MYRIGIINEQAAENEVAQFIKSLDKEKFECNALNNGYHDIENEDAVIIFCGTEDSVFTTTCSNIIKIRSRTNAFLWICQKDLDETKRVVYLQLGADNNIDAKCSTQEIKLLIGNAIKHRKISFNPETSIFDFTTPVNRKEEDSVYLNPNNLSVEINNFEIGLTCIEYQLFSLLKNNAGKAFSYQEIYKNIWKTPSPNEKSRIANVIFRIRMKFEKNSLDFNYIHTVRSVGYMFRN